MWKELLLGKCCTSDHTHLNKIMLKEMKNEVNEVIQGYYPYLGYLLQTNFISIVVKTFMEFEDEFF